MKKILTSIFGFAILSSAHAGLGSKHIIEGQLGMNSGAFAFGADYEYRVYDYLGLGGLFLYGAGDDDKLVPQSITFAGTAKVHLMNNEHIDFYAGPGLGISMVEGGSGTSKEDETAISPLVKTGALFKINEQVAVGASHTVILNWSTDEFGPLFNSLQYFLLDVQISF